MPLTGVQHFAPAVRRLPRARTSHHHHHSAQHIAEPDQGSAVDGLVDRRVRKIAGSALAKSIDDNLGHSRRIATEQQEVEQAVLERGLGVLDHLGGVSAVDPPQHERAKQLMTGFGGMIAFETGSLAAARGVLDNVRLCALAESLGGVETLISHPGTMTHASIPAEQRARLGITEGLVRISVGIEDVEDIIADLDAALL